MGLIDNEWGKRDDIRPNYNLAWLPANQLWAWRLLGAAIRPGTLPNSVEPPVWSISHHLKDFPQNDRSSHYEKGIATVNVSDRQLRAGRELVSGSPREDVTNVFIPVKEQ